MTKAATIGLWVTGLFGLAIAFYYAREEASEPAPVVENRSTFGGPTESASSDWAIVVFAEVDGAYGVIGRGGAHLDKRGVPIRAAIAYSLPQGESRVLVDNGRTYVRSAQQPYVWVDVSDPVGKIPGSAIPIALSTPQDGYSQVQSRTYGDDRFEVFERLNGVFQAEENTVLSSRDQYWTDTSGQVRRRIGITTISTKNKGITLVTVADRVGTDAVPEWYHFDSLFAPDRAIPAAAALRAIAHRGRSESDSRSYAGESSVLATNTRSPVRSISPRQSSPLLNFLISESEAHDLPENHEHHYWGDAGTSVMDNIQPPGQLGLARGVQDERDPGELAISVLKLWGAFKTIKAGLGFYGVALKAGLVSGWFTPFLYMHVGAILIVAATIALVYVIVQGDPHITTLDGHSYVFQATGEFIIVEAPQFQVQQRFEGDKGRNTSVRATAIRVGAHVIEFLYTETSRADEALSVIVDGSSLKVDREGVNFKDGTYIARRGSGGNDLTVFSPDGSYVNMENLDRAQNVLMALSTDTKNKVTGGLAGTPDGVRENDFTLRDGTIMAMSEARTIEGLYGRFASSWRVQPKERLFTQGKAEDYLTAEYTDLPQSVTKVSDFSEPEIAKARQTCVEAGVDGDAALQDCTYDVLASGGDAGWAKMAASSGTVSSSAPSAVAAIVEARMPEGSPSDQQFWWTIVNPSTERKLNHNGGRQFTIDLLPGSYSVTVISGVFEGEKTIDVQSSVPNEFFVDLRNREIPVLSSPETVSAGEAMVFEWKGALSGNAYIIVVSPDAYKGYYNLWNHHRAIDGSPATLVAPVEPGSFEILYVDDLTETILFRKPLEVTPAEVRFTGPEEVSAGTEFEFSWDGPNASGDYIFIAKPEMRSDAESTYHHLTRNGVQARLTAPTSPGVYELRYYSYGNQKMLAKHKLIVR